VDRRTGPRADARRAHGSAGASRPTRRPGGLVGARRRAEGRAESGSRADIGLRRGVPATVRRGHRRASRVIARRVPPRRQAAHGGAPWRSHAITARPRRSRAGVRCDHRALASATRRMRDDRRAGPRVEFRRAWIAVQAYAPTPAARMGAPGRRVRRDGPAVSSGRGDARRVERSRGAAPTSDSGVEHPRPFVAPRSVARPRATRVDAPPSRARRRALAFRCVHRASTSESGGSPLRSPRAGVGVGVGRGRADRRARGAAPHATCGAARTAVLEIRIESSSSATRLR
jgi:hypothetical protein